MPRQETPAEQGPEVRDGLRLLVAALVGLEALALLAGTVLLVVEGLGAERPVNAIGLAVIAGLIGVALAGCVRGLRQGAPWTRGPVLTWQLLQAGVGMPVSASAYWYYGIPILAIAVVVFFLIVGGYVIAREEDATA